MKLHLPHWVTKTLNENNEVLLLNWKTKNSVCIYDTKHPVYRFAHNNEVDVSDLSSEYVDDVEWLIQEGLVLSDSTSNNNAQKFDKPDRFDSDTLHLILLPAGEACNLDCVYCYENHDDISTMKTEHAQTLLTFIQSQNIKRVSIEYFGGEPLLNLRFIKHFSSLLSKHQIEFNCSITTNGTLINEKVLSDLYEAKVKSFQITLDGPKEIHNSLRVSKSKTLDSFESVCNALRVLAKSDYQDLSVMLRMNVNHQTIDEVNFLAMVEVIESIVDKNDRRFILLPKLISDYASANNVVKKDAEMIYCKSTMAKSVMDKFEKYIFNNYLSADALFLTKKGGYSCYAGNAKSLVVTPDLQLRKCTVAMEDPMNIVGRIKENGELSLNSNMELWIKDYSNQYCNSCFIQQSCQGNACPLENIKKQRKICPSIKNDSGFLTEKVIKFYERF